MGWRWHYPPFRWGLIPSEKRCRENMSESEFIGVRWSSANHSQIKSELITAWIPYMHTCTPSWINTHRINTHTNLVRHTVILASCHLLMPPSSRCNFPSRITCHASDLDACWLFAPPNLPLHLSLHSHVYLLCLLHHDPNDSVPTQPANPPCVLSSGLW